MTLKEFLKKKQISIYALAKASDVPYTTLNELVNGKKDINRMMLGTVRNIANALDLSTDKLLALTEEAPIKLSKGRIIIKDQYYYLDYSGRRPICKANKTNSLNIRFFAEEEIKNIDDNRRFKEWINSIT